MKGERDFRRLVVVSNRLPVKAEQDSAGAWHLEAGSGGLVTALSPVLQSRGGMWIGWPGGYDVEKVEQLLRRYRSKVDLDLVPVFLTEEDIRLYYQGFANEILWPLFHDLVSFCNFDPTYWPAYRNVNRKFAEVISQHTVETDYIWVNDYHLMLVGQELCERERCRRVGFFLHIPFPPVDIFLKLPWRKELLEALLSFDVIGFQTLRDKRNFQQCVRLFFDNVRVNGGRYVGTIDHSGRKIAVGAFPISIDFDDFDSRSRDSGVSELVKEYRLQFGETTVMLGLDRLDYTKGIPERIKAFGFALANYPELHGKISLLQIVVPSRDGVGQYQLLKDEIDRLIGNINGAYGSPDWTPIHYLFRPLDETELIVFYRMSKIALITPLKDGMNLVAKEFCACSWEGDSVLILSEFAGAASQIHRGALLVNPYDIDGMARAIRHADAMEKQEKRRRMSHNRQVIRRQNIYSWLDTFLKTSIARKLDNFPLKHELYAQNVHYSESMAPGEDNALGNGKEPR